jgi:hypothetical protein
VTRRGRFLLLFGGIWAAIGYGIFTSPPNPTQAGGLRILLRVVAYTDLGWLWLGAGVVACVAAFVRRRLPDFLGFLSLMLPTMIWSGCYVVTAARDASLRFLLGALVYGALASAVYLISGGVEGPPPKRQQ